MLNVSLLRRSSTFRALWLARTISFFGDTVATTALVAYSYGRYGTGITVSLVLLAQSLPRLFGFFAGSLADRFDQRRLMVWCDMGQAVVWTSIVLVSPPLPLLLVLVLCAGTLATIFMPAGRSAVPVLAGERDLPAANALLGVGINAGLALGPVVGGVLVAWIGLGSVLLINSLTFAISALLLRRLPALPPSAASNDKPMSLIQTTRGGLRYLAQHATARAVSISLFLIVAFGALDNVALVALAQSTLGAGAAGYGVLASAYGVGMVLGPLLLLRWSERIDPARTLLWGTALLGVGGLLTGFAPTLLAAVLAQSAGGIGNGFENIGNDTLIQRTVPRAMLGRVFGTVYSGAFLASSLAAALGGPLLDWTSPRTVFIISGSGVLLGLAVLWFLLPRHAATDHQRAENNDRIEGASET
jgi:MFS family permease